MAESFFATLKTEFYCRRIWPTKARAGRDVGSWIENRHNRGLGTPRSDRAVTSRSRDRTATGPRPIRQPRNPRFRRASACHTAHERG